MDNNPNEEPNYNFFQKDNFFQSLRLEDSPIYDDAVMME